MVDAERIEHARNRRAVNGVLAAGVFPGGHAVEGAEGSRGHDAVARGGRFVGAFGVAGCERHDGGHHERQQGLSGYLHTSLVRRPELPHE